MSDYTNQINPATGVPYGIGFIGQPQDTSGSVGSYLDVNNPDSYIQAAKDLADQNTRTSQAMAREQMAFQKEANAKAMAFSASEAQKTRDWQELMSNTSHQREVADLIGAGLNPILSANQGASTPQGATAQGVTSAGAKGSVDTSAVAGIFNIFQQLNNMRIAEKQIDANLVMNVLSNETTRYAADKGSYASMYGANASAAASRYAANSAYAASKYGWDMQYQMMNDFPGLDKLTSNLVGTFLDNMSNVAGSANIPQAMNKMLNEMFPSFSYLWDKILPTKPAGRSSQNDYYDDSSGRSHGMRSYK